MNGQMTIEQKFKEYHQANPHVYERLRAMALQARARGREKIGIGMLYEVLRWEHAMATTDPSSEFKLDNNYKPYYARLIMQSDPRLAGIFETRELRHRQHITVGNVIGQ